MASQPMTHSLPPAAHRDVGADTSTSGAVLIPQIFRLPVYDGSFPEGKAIYVVLWIGFNCLFICIQFPEPSVSLVVADRSSTRMRLSWPRSLTCESEEEKKGSRLFITETRCVAAPRRAEEHRLMSGGRGPGGRCRWRSFKEEEEVCFVVI